MFKKLRPHLFLALAFTVLTLAQQYGFYALKGLPIVFLPLGKYLGLFIFLLFFTFAQGAKSRFLMLSFVMMLNFFQMSHLSYFGTQILPSEIYLLFTQALEIGGTLKAELHHIVIPLLFTLLPMGLGWVANRKLTSTYQWKVIPLLFVLYFAYNPIRTYLTGNTWGRQPSTRELSGMNVYLATSYFLGKILPSKWQGNQSIESNSSLQLEMSPAKEVKWDKIIVILGESLTPNHMELYGYKKPTTPFLNTLKKDPSFFYTIGLSGGVSTDISVAFFLNMGFGASGSLKAAKGQHCLFKLAKNQQFSTHFLSIQSSEQLRYIAPYICTSSLDDYRSLEDIAPNTPDHQAAVDRNLLGPLATLLKKEEPQFIMLHQRGSHAPWALRSTPHAKIFRPDPNDANSERIADYDNSVVEFDLFWKELDALLTKSTKRILVIYLSDHGEGVGENGHWGHGSLNRESFEVPIMMKSYNRRFSKRTRQLPVYLPHYNLALYMARELGYKTNQKPVESPQDYVIFGNDIDGFAGKAQIKFGPFHQYDYEVIP